MLSQVVLYSKLYIRLTRVENSQKVFPVKVEIHLRIDQDSQAGRLMAKEKMTRTGCLNGSLVGALLRWFA